MINELRSAATEVRVLVRQVATVFSCSGSSMLRGSSSSRRRRRRRGSSSSSNSNLPAGRVPHPIRIPILDTRDAPT
jgi:hypothetical protein